MKEPKMVELFYDMMEIEQDLNKETGYVKMCGSCNLEFEGAVGMAKLYHMNMMPMRGKKGGKGGKRGPMNPPMDPFMMEMIMDGMEV